MICVFSSWRLLDKMRIKKSVDNWEVSSKASSEMVQLKSLVLIMYLEITIIISITVAELSVKLWLFVISSIIVSKS